MLNPAQVDCCGFLIATESLPLFIQQKTLDQCEILPIGKSPNSHRIPAFFIPIPHRYHPVFKFVTACDKPLPLLGLLYSEHDVSTVVQHLGSVMALIKGQAEPTHLKPLASSPSWIMHWTNAVDSLPERYLKSLMTVSEVGYQAFVDWLMGPISKWHIMQPPEFYRVIEQDASPVDPIQSLLHVLSKL